MNHRKYILKFHYTAPLYLNEYVIILLEHKFRYQVAEINFYNENTICSFLDTKDSFILSLLWYTEVSHTLKSHCVFCERSFFKDVLMLEVGFLCENCHNLYFSVYLGSLCNFRVNPLFYVLNAYRIIRI